MDRTKDNTDHPKPLDHIPAISLALLILAHVMTADERLTFQKMLGVLIGFFGVYVMIQPELKDGSSWSGMGQVAVLGAALSYSFAGIFGKKREPYTKRFPLTFLVY